jgi:hypothetical protein
MKLNKLMIALVVMLSSFAASAQAQVAKIGETSFATLSEAIAAATAGQTITLVANFSVDTETYTIGAGKSVVLDMNGKTITVTDNKQGTSSAANYELFYIVDGNLTVTGDGTINLTSTHNRAWNAMSAIFHNRGGVLTIENGTFKNLGGTDMAYVVDNSGNHYGDATTNIYDGTLYSTYTAIRNRMEQNEHGASGKVYLNIYGGNINGGTSAVWAQAASTSTTAPATGEINISGGQVGLVNTARSAGAESMTTITGGTVAGFKGEVGELTVNGGAITGDVTILTSEGEVADYVIDEDGAYVEKSAAIAMVGAKEFTDINAAFEAADGKVVTILQDLELTETILVECDYDVTVEGTGVTISFVNDGNGFQVETGAILTLGAGLSIVGAGANVCPLYIEDATVISAANISTTSGNASAPIVHKARSASVTINGGTIQAGNPAVATIDWTSMGTLTVNGGSVQGASAIHLTSGSLIIEDGKFQGVEAAVVIETAGGKKGVSAVAINGGTFTSEGTEAILSRSTDISVGAMSHFISGGTFSSNVEELVAVGYKVQDNGNGTYSVVRDDSTEYVAQIGAQYYISLADAVAAMMPMSELVLLKDVTLTAPIELEMKSGVINLNGKTVTAQCKDAFRVSASTTIKNGKIVSEARCVNTRQRVDLVLQNLELKATSLKHGNPQPITIGGSAHGTNVDMSNVSVDFVGYCPGYSIISFVQTNLTATECQFTNAYNVLYAREDNASNSVFTFNNCHMYAKSPAYAESNAFALIAIRANNVIVNINGSLLHCDGQVSALNLHGLKASTLTGNVYATGCTIKLSADTEVIGDMISESNENFSKNTIILPATEDYINQLTAENFLVIDNGDGTVTPSKNLKLVDGDAYTNKADLEGMEISYQRNFANANVWNAVFLPFDVPASALENYDIAVFTDVLTETDADNKVTAWGLELTLVDSIQANTPCFVRAKNEAAKAFNITLSYAKLYGTVDGPHNVKSNAYMTCALTGNYETIPASTEFKEGGWVVSGAGKFVHSTSSMKPFRLYLTRELKPGVELNITNLTSMRILVRKPNGTTSIENVDTEAIGQQTTATYDLQGRNVVNPTKGAVYIVNGKKVVK